MTDLHTNIPTRLDRALRVAAWAHQGQVRKGTDIPYIIHPFSVMNIAATATRDEDVLIACLLHDILEDVPERYGRDAMARDFGDRVVATVEGVTKDDSIRDWRVRSEAYLRHLRSATDESIIVSAADKIHNLQSILIDYEAHGEQLWLRFNAGKAQQRWWYDAVAGVLEERLPASVLTEQLRQLVRYLEKI